MGRNNQKEVPRAHRLKCLKPKLKIAFCGDNEGELQILQSTLEDAGYRYTICARAFSGKELLYALSTSEAEPPDVILLDILILFADGLETLEKIRRDAKLRNVSVLLMTGSSEYAQAVLKKYPHLAIDGILTKPVTVDSLSNLRSYPTHSTRHCDPMVTEGNGNSV
jgi:CheY-like chemotaxis protein